LPAADLQSALEQLAARVPGLLDELRLTHGAISVVGTPRRLVVTVEKLAAFQQEKETLVKGPPTSRGFDANGQPTRAAEGFAQGKGLSVSDLQTREIDGGSYLVAIVKEVCHAAHQVLRDALARLVEGIKFDKTMRWNHTNVPFSRPVRWLLALHGEGVVPFEFAGLTAGNVTQGLRFHEPSNKAVRSLDEYRGYLTSQGILLDPQERREAIRAQVNRLCAEVGGSAVVDEALLDEVNTLVEAPTGLLGKFDPSHLELPPEVLISVMKKHQRYFPVFDASGALLPYFIAVRNGDGRGLDVVTDGNEQVIRARFTDAHFFIKEDLQHKLEDLLGRLGTLTFQYKLGSMLDKSRRVTALVEPLAGALTLTTEEKTTALRAATLCKADLVSHMVVEMTSLQGIMGRYYALNSGETPAVADAIGGHYLPRFTGDKLPATKPGLAVGIADRLDSLVGLFAAGLAPTGTKDPFAQRRAAIGLVQLLSTYDLDFDLRKWMQLAADKLPLVASDDSLQACLEFVSGRQRSNLKKEFYSIDPQLFEEPTEKALFDALVNAESGQKAAGSVQDTLNAFLPMIPAVNAFFDSVLVMADDARVRGNRLGLLQRIAALTTGVADLSRLEGF